MWRAPVRVVLDTPAGRIELRHGVLQLERVSLDDLARERAAADGPCPRHLVDEILEVAAWLERHAGAVRVVEVDGELASPWPGVPQP